MVFPSIKFQTTMGDFEKSTATCVHRIHKTFVYFPIQQIAIKMSNGIPVGKDTMDSPMGR